MTDEQKRVQELFAKRIALVGEISRLNSVQLQNTQQFSGNQIDLLRCTTRAASEPATEEHAALEQELTEASARDAALKAKISECTDRIQCLEGELDALDRELEELQNQQP